MKRGIFLVVFLLLMGCGRKTSPVPPDAVIPEAIANLKYRVDDTGVTLSWTYPKRSIDGKHIENIRVFHLHKAKIPEFDYCGGCPVLYNEVVNIDARGTKPNGSVIYLDTDLQPGFHYVYMVQSDSGWYITSSESNRVDFSYQSILRAPLNPKIAVGDHELMITWSPVTEHDDGTKVTDVTYQVYRGTSRMKLSPCGDVVDQPEFVNKGIPNERTYYYNVRAVTVADEFQILGHASETISEMALDMVSPVPPRNIKVVGLSTGVQLHWMPVTNTDLGGYHIYHQRKGDTDWQRLGTAPKGAIGFKDMTKLAPGVHYFVVTSFDIGLRHNESEYSLKVRYVVP